jgi:hypothetical protein
MGAGREFASAPIAKPAMPPAISGAFHLPFHPSPAIAALFANSIPATNSAVPFPAEIRMTFSHGSTIRLLCGRDLPVAPRRLCYDDRGFTKP